MILQLTCQVLQDDVFFTAITFKEQKTANTHYPSLEHMLSELNIIDSKTGSSANSELSIFVRNCQTPTTNTPINWL